MSSKLFVSNLPFTLTEEEMSGFFSAVGQVLSVKIIHDKETQRSRGFGFVEMSTPDQAVKAIQKLDGLLLKGRPIKVVEARPRESMDESTTSKKLLMG